LQVCTCNESTLDLRNLYMLCGEQMCFTYCTLLNTMVHTHNIMQAVISSKQKYRVSNFERRTTEVEVGVHKQWNGLLE